MECSLNFSHSSSNLPGWWLLRLPAEEEEEEDEAEEEEKEGRQSSTAQLITLFRTPHKSTCRRAHMDGARLRPSPPSATKPTSRIFLVQVGRVGGGVMGRARLEVAEITEGLRLHGDRLVPQAVTLCRRRR